MKTKTLLFPIVALLAVFLVSAVSAGNVVSGEAVVQIKNLNINYPSNHNLILAAAPGEIVPVTVSFRANASDYVSVKVEISSGNEEYSVSTKKFDVLEDTVYTTGVMNLKIPTRIDDLSKDVRLNIYVRSDNISNDEYWRNYTIRIQRESYKLQVLSVDYDLDANAGSTVPVMVVVKNTGFRDNDNVYLTVAVPELGISAKTYLDELTALKDCDNCCDSRVSISKILNLNIPSNAKEGVYDLVVTVWNEDTKTVEKGIIKIGKSSSSTPGTVATNKEQDLKAGETNSYDLVIVNSDNSVKVYTLSVVSNSNLDVTVPSTVIVNPQSASTVKVDVKVKNGAEAGRHTFGVLVNGEQTTFVANVNKKGTSASSAGVIALTVLLAIIFVALLVLLIVLLFQREKKVEEVETSYY